MNTTIVPTPHQSSRHGHPVKLIVLHADGGKSDAGTVAWIKNPESKVSYHYLVGRDGTVYQFVGEEAKAWHAGLSGWGVCTVDGSVNPTSIGVAFANDGTEPYEEIQYRMGAQLVHEICERHDIPEDMIVGHCDVSPGRKTDPWEHFDWSEFRHWLRREYTEGE